MYNLNNWDFQVWGNIVDPDQNAASQQGLHVLPFIQQFLDISAGGKMELFKILRQVW